MEVEIIVPGLSPSVREVRCVVGHCFRIEFLELVLGELVEVTVSSLSRESVRLLPARRSLTPVLELVECNVVIEVD